MFELVLLIRFSILFAQAGDDLCEQRQRPLSFVDPLGRHRAGVLARITRFDVSYVYRNEVMPSASLLGSGLIPLVGQEVLERDQQESAKPTSLGIRRGQRFLFQQPRKKLLRQILRLFGAGAAAAGVSVQWIPIGVAQRGERFAGGRRSFVARGQNDAPMRRIKVGDTFAARPVGLTAS